MTDHYVIQEGWGTSRGEKNTYWHNENGWSDLEDATVYTLAEINTFEYLPFGSSHVVKLPNYSKPKRKAHL